MAKGNTLRKQGIGMISILAVEYLLGMITTFFVHFPEDKHGEQLWQFSWTQPPLALHIIIGMTMVIGAIVLIIRSIRQKNKSWIIASIGGYIGIQVAALTGGELIPTQSDIYSFTMGVSFLAAFLFYGWGVYKSR